MKVTELYNHSQTKAYPYADVLPTVRAVHDAFGQQRFGKEWPDTLGRMQRWLSREERRAA